TRHRAARRRLCPGRPVAKSGRSKGSGSSRGRAGSDGAGRGGAAVSVVSMMDRLRARVAEQRRQEAELEALGPGAVEAARRERAKREAERIAADRAAHESEQEAGLVAHLERCGMGSLDAQRVAGGLSDTWGWVDVPGRDGSPQKRVQALAAVRDWWRG